LALLIGFSGSFSQARLIHLRSINRVFKIIFSELSQCVSGHAKYCPFRHRNRSQFLEEDVGRLIPVQTPPLEPFTIPFLREFCHLRQKSFSEPQAPHFRHHIQVFDIKTRSVEEGGVIVEEEHESDRFSLLFSNNDFGGVLFEQCFLSDGLV